MNTLFDKYITILKITKQIIRHPFAFGETIEDKLATSKQAARYLVEGVIFSLAIFQLVITGQGEKFALLDLPFAGEIIGAVMVGSVLLTGLATHPFARLFSPAQTSIHGSFAAFLYWSGFCLFVIPPIAALLIIGFKWLLSSVSLAVPWQLLLFALTFGPLFIIYYLGTIASWIGQTYKISTSMGGLAILFGYALSMVLAGGLFAAYTALIR